MTKPITNERLEEISYWFAKYPLQMRLQHHLPVRIVGLECTDEIRRLREELDLLEGENRLNCAAVSSLAKKLDKLRKENNQARELLEQCLSLRLPTFNPTIRDEICSFLDGAMEKTKC